MLTQTEVRPAAADVFETWPTAASVKRPSPRVTAEQFREALSGVASSVSIVSTDGAHGIAGFTCSAVCSVTDEPPTIMVCVNRKSAANAIIKANGVLCVSSLGAEQALTGSQHQGFSRMAPGAVAGDDHQQRLVTSLLEPAGDGLTRAQRHLVL